jgi:hypothetical protein
MSSVYSGMEKFWKYYFNSGGWSDQYGREKTDKGTKLNWDGYESRLLKNKVCVNQHGELKKIATYDDVEKEYTITATAQQIARLTLFQDYDKQADGTENPYYKAKVHDRAQDHHVTLMNESHSITCEGNREFRPK